MYGYNWISKFCMNSKYILRINDDVIVNTFYIIKYLKKLNYSFNQMFGFRIEGKAPIRIPGSKYFVSTKEYT